MFSNVKEYVDGLIKNKGIPYIDVSVYKDHKSLYRYYAGKNVNGKENLFLFSCTKPMLVALVMRFMEEGKISLNDTIEKYLPEYKNTSITIEHLLTMSAGLTYNLNDYPVKEAVKIDDGRTDTLKIIDSFVKVPLAFKPGEKYAYSLCHDVLGGVIEVVSGKKLSVVMREKIFNPLNMNNTYFSTRENSSVAPLFWAYPDKGIVEIDKENPFIFTDGYECGGAGLVSTVADYVKFADALACGGVPQKGERILKESSIKLMCDKQHVEESLKKGFACTQGADYGYGLGVRVRAKETDWGLPVGEFGWDGAAGSYLMVDTVNKISVVIGMHLRGWTSMFIGEHLNIVKEIYKAL